MVCKTILSVENLVDKNSQDGLGNINSATVQGILYCEINAKCFQLRTKALLKWTLIQFEAKE